MKADAVDTITLVEVRNVDLGTFMNMTLAFLCWRIEGGWDTGSAQ
jgi:hypothetical protein